MLEVAKRIKSYVKESKVRGANWPLETSSLMLRDRSKCVSRIWF